MRRRYLWGRGFVGTEAWLNGQRALVLSHKPFAHVLVAIANERIRCSSTPVSSGLGPRTTG